MSVRKCAVAVIVAVVATGVISPIASAQDARQQCWADTWARTGDPVLQRFRSVVDPATGLPYPTVPAVMGYVESLLSFYPAMSSHTVEGTIHCGY